MGERVVTVEFPVYGPSGWCSDLPDLIACARAGIAAWGYTPPAGIVDEALRPRRLAELAVLCDRLEQAYRDGVAETQAGWRQARLERRRLAREMLA